MRASCLKVCLLGLLGVIAYPLVIGAQNPPAGRGAAPNPLADVPVLPYKMVDWPVLPTSVAGFPVPWNFVNVSGIAAAPGGHIFLVHRGAYPVMEFESTGKVVRSWGDGLLISEGTDCRTPLEPDRTA